MATENGLVSILVLLGLSAAFDTIDHEILLQRLQQHVGIKGTALDWFKSYLSERFQFFNVNNDFSTDSSMHTQVSHGGPKLLTSKSRQN